MTIYDKGLIRAMKKAYRDSGYDVALTENGILIQAPGWGAEILADACPNSVKSLIVLHNGSMPKMNTAVKLCKGACESEILEVALSTLENLEDAYTTMGGLPIKPTRLLLDGLRAWQTTTDLKIKLVDVEDQQILAGERFDAHLISGYIFGRSWFGCMYVATRPVLPEDKPLIDHLAQMQWISLDGEV